MDGKRRRLPLVLLAESEGLLRLHEILGSAMAKNGLSSAKDFAPHMTLFYGPTPILVQAIEPIRFVARDFALVHSERGCTRYTMLSRWPLKDPSARIVSEPFSSRI